MHSDTLDSAVATTGHSVKYTALISMKDAAATHKVRFRIYVDSNPSQSRAIAERFNGEQWLELAGIHPTHMRTNKHLFFKRETKKATERDFLSDHNELLRLTLLIFN